MCVYVFLFFFVGGDGGRRFRSYFGGSVGFLVFCGLGPGFGFRLEASLFFCGGCFAAFCRNARRKIGLVLRFVSVFWGGSLASGWLHVFP